MFPFRPGLALSAFALAASVHAADFYVSPSGSPTNTGSQASPWDLQTALDQPPAVQPGDTIWLRGGTYVGHFTSSLTGNSSSAIVVRQYAGERAAIDGNDGTSNPALVINGSYAWFWGFEVTNSNPNRISSDTNPPPNRGEGVQLLGPNTKLINMVIHDADQGVLTTANTNEVYGNIVYYNGYSGTDRGHGHGVYAQHQGSTPKPIHDNVIFDQFGFGIHAYAEGGYLDYLDFEGNTSFNNGGISPNGWTTNILVGGLRVATSPRLVDNHTYNSALDGMNDTGYSAGCTNPTISNNYFESGTAMKLVSCTGVAMTGNTFYGSLSGFTPAQFPNNTYHASRPTGTKVFVRPNQYEPGRATVTVYNWDLAGSVPVDLGSVLAAGAYFELRNAQNPFGAPVLSGTYAGNPVAFPMTGMSPAVPVGMAAPPPTGPEFNVFILTSTLGPDEFYDVPQASPFHPAVHTISADGITSGCGGGYFCPNASVTRAQLAVFLLKAEHGSAWAPPAPTGAVFDDVPANAFAAAWIEKLSAEGITSGCGGGRFCPDVAVTREQMAVLLLRTTHGPAYAPPAATGVFDDVPAADPFAPWIEELASEGITAGCGGGHFCPQSPSTRAQMAAFLVAAFALP